MTCVRSMHMLRKLQNMPYGVVDMLLKLFLAFTLIPVLEIYLLIKIGYYLGAFNTVVVVIVTALLGASLARHEGTRTMIRVRESLNRHDPVRVEIYVPEGRKLSQKPLNARLGIVGGISILGTTGIVKPLSHDAYFATIRSALSVARAQGHDRIVLTTGRRSERFAQTAWADVPDECFVQIGDFFKQSLEMASSKGFERIWIAVFFGKAIKMAQGIPHTHAGKSALILRQLGDWTRQVTGDSMLADRIDGANTAREAFYLLIDRYPEVIAHVGKRIVASAQTFIGTTARVRSVIFGFDGSIVFDSEQK